MNLLKDNWTYAKVSDFAELLRGISYKKDESRKESQKGYKPILRSNNINYELNFVDLVYVPEKKIKSIQYIKEGDIVFAMSSGSKHLVGKSAQSKSSYDGSYGAFCGLLRVSNLMNKKYVGLFFKSQEYRKYISGISKGTNINNLKRDHVLEINFPLPPLNEQNRIVEKITELFSDLDKATEDLKKTQEQLKIYRQAVLKAAFEGQLTEEWRRKNISRLAGEVLKIKNENIDELFKIPKSWKWLKILQIGEVETGTTPRKNVKSNYGQDYPFYKPTDLEAGINVRKAREYLSKKGLSKARFLPKNSILVTCIGATIGKTGIIRLPGASNQQINAIIPYKFANPDFIYYQVICPYFQEQIISKSSSTTLPILNKSRFKELLIVMATKEEQEQIVQEIESRLSVCDKLEETVQQSLEKIEYLRQSILKKAFEGKLVPQWPDLPAPQPGKYWVYVIKCNNDSNYIGFTSNLKHRWEQHLLGEGAEWTKKHKPQYIMYWEEFDSKADAITREDKLKTGYGRKWIKREEKQGRLWRAGESAEKLLERIKQEKEKFESNNKKRKKR